MAIGQISANQPGPLTGGMAASRQPTAVEAAQASKQSASPKADEVTLSAGIDAETVARIEHDILMSRINYEQPRERVGDAMDKVLVEVNHFQADLKAIRPDISAADWDFSMKDGKLVAKSTVLRKQDVDWISSQLNADKALVAAAKQFNTAAATYYQKTEDHPTLTGIMSAAREVAAYENGAEQVNAGAIPFKKLMSKWLDSVRVGIQGPSGMVCNQKQIDFLVSIKARNVAADKLAYKEDPVPNYENRFPGDALFRIGRVFMTG